MKKRALLQCAFVSIILLTTSLLSFSQVEPEEATGFRITGKVTDEAGKPIEGVTVQVKGMQAKGVFSITRRDGSFSIMASSRNATLVFSSVGFREEEAPIDGRRISLLPG